MSTVAAPGAPMRETTRRLKPELEQLYREHSQMLYRTAHSMLGNAADAEDVLQNVFLTLLRREPDMESNAKGYLYRAAINLSLNAIRVRKRLEFTDDDARLDALAGARGGNPGEDLRERFAEAMADLSPDDAQVLVLRYIQEHSDKEISRLLGISRGSVAMRLFRSRRRLKKLMQGRTGDKP
jgi:RNA polymerase sigma-70 factor (ECF subfamily)